MEIINYIFMIIVITLLVFLFRKKGSKIPITILLIFGFRIINEELLNKEVIDYRDIQNRTVSIYGNLKSEKFMEEFRNMEKNNDEIYIYINSYKTSFIIPPLFSKVSKYNILDFTLNNILEFEKSKTKKICIAKNAISSAFLLFQMCDKRIIIYGANLEYDGFHKDEFPSEKHSIIHAKIAKRMNISEYEFLKKVNKMYFHNDLTAYDEEILLKNHYIF